MSEPVVALDFFGPLEIKYYWIGNIFDKELQSIASSLTLKTHFNTIGQRIKSKYLNNLIAEVFIPTAFSSKTDIKAYKLTF